MSDKKISELPKLSKAYQSDLLTLEQNGRGKSVTAVQLLGRDTGWRNIAVPTGYLHTNNSVFPQYRKIGKVTYLRGQLFIPSYNLDINNSDDASVHVNSNVIHYHDEYLAFTNLSCYRNIPYRMQPLSDFQLKNILISRRYQAIDANNNAYALPITSVVNLTITSNGAFIIKGIASEEWAQLKPGTLPSHYTHPLRMYCTKVNQGQAFSDFSQVSVGDSTNDNALKLPVFGSLPVTAPEDIDTANHFHLGGFSIPLDGICFISEDDQYYTYTKSLYE